MSAREKLIAERVAVLETADDKGVATDIVKMLLDTVLVDKHQNTAFGLEVVKGAVASNTYTIVVTGLMSISMHELSTSVSRHENVHDMGIENEGPGAGGGRRALTVNITVYRVGARSKESRGWHQVDRYITDDNTAGLVVPDASKSDVRDIIDTILNMEQDMWEPKFSLANHSDQTRYVLMAMPVQHITMSFYKYLTTNIPDVITTIVISQAMSEDLIPCLSLQIHCRAAPPDTAPLPPPPPKKHSSALRTTARTSHSIAHHPSSSSLHSNPGLIHGLLTTLFGQK